MGVFYRAVITPLTLGIGAATYDLIRGEKSKIAENDIIKNFTRKFSETDSEKILQAIQSLITSQDTKVKHFLLSQMSASFCTSSCKLSQADLNKLNQNGKTIQFNLLLDTNFIYSILQLHDNTSNDAADALLNIISNCPDGIKIKLYVLPITIDETKAVLYANFKAAQSIQSSPNISHVASERLSGILQKYFKAAGKNPTMNFAEKYFKPHIENLIGILRDKGIEIYNQNIEGYSTRQDIVDDINNRIEHEENTHKEKKRTYESLLHDIILWHVADENRPPRVDSITDANFWITTIDYRFLGWDEYKRWNRTSSTPVCIHPSSLVQMLQLWIPRNPQMEAAILDTLRLPFFYQEFDSKSEQITIQILETISRFENANNLSIEAIENIVINNALRTRISLTEDENQQIEYVKEAFISQNKILESKLAQANKVLASQLENHKTELEEKNQELEAIKVQLKKSDRTLESLKQESERQKENKLKRYKSISQYVSWSLVITIDILIVFTAKTYLPLIMEKWNSIEPISELLILLFPVCLAILGINTNLLHVRKNINRFILSKFFNIKE